MTAISIRLEDKDKQALDEMCAEMGMSVSTFFTHFLSTKSLALLKSLFLFLPSADGGCVS